MKKILVVCAALFMLPCSLLYSQEADEPGTGAEFTIIPRFDIGAEYLGKGGDKSYALNLGNSSIYTLFEGNFTENLSFSIANHWASFGTDAGDWDKTWYTDLYDGTGYSNTNSWLDWINLTYEVGNFYFTVGKDAMFVGGLEYDEYDFDVHPVLASSLWNNLPCYQWGASAGWTSDSENTTLALQMVTSPYGEHPFSSGLYSYGARWTGEYGKLETNMSLAAIAKGEGKYFGLFSLGQRYNFSEKWALSYDFFNTFVDLGWEWDGEYEDEAGYYGLQDGLSIYGALSWKPSEKWEVLVRGGYEWGPEYFSEENDYSSWQAGAALHWYPVEGLRVHAAFGCKDDIMPAAAYIGVMYNLNIKIW